VVHNGGWYNQQINTVYHEMAEHYDAAIILACVRAPKEINQMKKVAWEIFPPGLLHRCGMNSSLGYY